MNHSIKLLFCLLSIFMANLMYGQTISSFSPANGSPGTLVTITGTGLTSPTALNIGGVNAIIISSTATKVVGYVMPGSVTGSISITTASGTATSSGNLIVNPTAYPVAQQGGKLAASDNIGSSQQGCAIAISADGNTAAVGGYGDYQRTGAVIALGSTTQGAVWIYTRTGTTWTEQAKLTENPGTFALSGGNQTYNIISNYGICLALSADGNRLVVGAGIEWDVITNSVNQTSSNGAYWSYTRSGSTWTGEATFTTVVLPAGNLGIQNIALSADGKTLVLGDASSPLAFYYSGGSWTQQVNAVPLDAGPTGTNTYSGPVAISADGKTVACSGFSSVDNSNYLFVFVEGSNGFWTQQAKILGTGRTGLALNADGSVLLVGEFGANGTASLYTRTGTSWSSSPVTLTGTFPVGDAAWGNAGNQTPVSLSADGKTAIFGSLNENGLLGATWVFTQTGTNVWTQQGVRFEGNGAIGKAYQGFAMALSADGSTAMEGGFADNSGIGAAWVMSGPDQWTGVTSTDWSTASNWSWGAVPTGTDAALIPATFNLPIIATSTTVSVSNLTIYSGASLTVNGTLQISGTISNAGIFDATNGTISMNGSASQLIPAGAFKNNTIQNLTISTGVALAGPLSVTGVVTVTSTGGLNTQGFLTLVSSSTGSASIAQGLTTGSYIQGNVTVQRYVGSSQQWRMIGFPFKATTTLSGSSLAGFYSTPYLAYNFNPLADNGNYVNNGGASTLNAGWTAFSSGTLTSDKGILISGGPSSTINFNGPVNTGNQVITLSYAQVYDFTLGWTYRGWNLIANPFASNIDWNSITSNSSFSPSYIENAIYRYDPNTTAYATYVNGTSSGNQSNVIENGASFFVHVINPFTYINIRESDKTSSAPKASLFGLQPDLTQEKSIIKLALLKAGETNGDEVVVRWGVDPATDQFDSKYDAYDMGRMIGADLSVLGSDGTKYAIFHGSALQTKDKEQRVIALGTRNMTEGNYSFSTSLLSNMYDANEVYLVDHYTGQTTLISSNTASYAFMVTSDTASAVPDRFSIALNYKPKFDLTNNSIFLINNPSGNNQFNVVIGSDYQRVSWQVVDNQGKTIETGLFNNVKKGTVNIAVTQKIASGSYFIKLIGDGNLLPTQQWMKL